MKRFFFAAAIAIGFAVAVYILAKTYPRPALPGGGDSSPAPVITKPEPQKAVGFEEKKPETPVSAEVRAKLQLLDEVLGSKNDNDPRLDAEFRDLSFEAKQALREKYAALAPEDRNGRGTIIFLLGREIKSSEDLRFFYEVVSEAPCLSLQDCKSEAQETRGGDEDGGLGVSTTLAYPQLVSLVSLDRLVMAAGMNGLSRDMKDVAWKIIEAAKKSPVSAISRKASDIEAKLRATRS